MLASGQLSENDLNTLRTNHTSFGESVSCNGANTSTGFGIGLAIPISAPIFWFLLGGKDVKYVGPHPVNDFVAGWFKKQPAAPQPNPNMGNEGFREIQAVVNPQPIQSVAPTVAPVAPVQPTQVVQPAASVAKFCTSCGYKITNNEKFCPGCGKAV